MFSLATARVSAGNCGSTKTSRVRNFGNKVSKVMVFHKLGLKGDDFSSCLYLKGVVFWSNAYSNCGIKN